MKILYAAGNRPGSFFQMKRFLRSIAHQNHTIKTAAYKSSMVDYNVDYMLDSLLNYSKPEAKISFNGNYNYYSAEVNRFNPDLIISDMEPYTSTLALDLRIKLWVVSPIVLYYGLDDNIKNRVGVQKKYSYLITANASRIEYNNYMLKNCDRKFALTHLCDIESPPILEEGYEFARPNFVLGTNKNKIKNLIINSEKKIINEDDSVYFTKDYYEIYNKLQIKDINNEKEYISYISECENFITDATQSFLADAFYNEKFCYSIPRYTDMESVISSYMNSFYDVGSSNLSDDKKQIYITINDNVKFISEHLKEL